MRITRRSRYVIAGVVVVLALSVAFDVGHSATAHDRASDLRSLVSEVKSDMASCNSSVADSFQAYNDVLGGEYSKRHEAERVINGDEPYCTLAGNTDLYDLATLEVPGTLRPYNLQSVLQSLTSWAFPDAAKVINDIGNLLEHPGDAARQSDLTATVATMNQLAQSAQSAFDRAGRVLGTTVDELDLGATNGLRTG